MKLTKGLLVATLAVAFSASSVWAGTLTCSSLAKRGDADINGFIFSNTFREPVGINTSGDTLFVARPKGTRDRLYLYPGAGGSEVVAEGRTLAPGGGTFSSRSFTDISINDAGDLAFHGKLLSQGSGVFVREGGGALAAADLAGDAAPGGGAFEKFTDVSLVNSSGVVAYIAVVNGGTSGVYAHDIATGTTVAAVLNGDAVDNPAGRFLCEILDVELADGGALALRASTKVNCADGGEAAVEGIYHVSGGTVTEVALVGGAAPIASTTFADFIDGLSISSVEVAFVAKLAGAVTSSGVFTWNGATTTEVLQGDFEPDVGGSYKKFRHIQAVNTGSVFLNARFTGTTNNEAVMDLDGSPSAALEKSDTPPFGVSYGRLDNKMALAHDGSDMAIKVKIKDSVSPKTKAAVLRCS
jgi:hypothetical protein